MKTVLLIASFMILTGATMLAGQVRLSGFDIREEGRDFVITWQSELEEDVRQFEIQRKTPFSNDQFVRIHEAAAHGPNRAYGYRDSQVFKSGSDQVDYQLEVVYMNGVREVLKSQSMNYTTTAVRRTWGSLKAMFQ
ncbi:MAG: hypothetical protein HOC28_00540 [Bacteroidetes Order II. Incertae sedis bacterium]|jgi:hypothetical protein|nr:hypothetical protein [Bacteroidetes Order II. bacterium]MDG1755400.1 hypothetical protein [Rhodothermales bacterium]MBT4052779.1 hypothetical protein [Bacteroidetes Order II. bacterium]MBT4601597.1 hypothetical protein [Bacteroidetes Order II. bacterium]MBT5249920.1 hypothetical protein [Bacteroidetes Order II. bacterium]